MNKTQRMQITLSAGQTARLLDAAGTHTAAEVDADCEPSGYVLEIAITSVERWAEAIIGGQRLDLGDVNVQLIEEGAH